jgi:hypothetical protein
MTTANIVHNIAPEGAELRFRLSTARGASFAPISGAVRKIRVALDNFDRGFAVVITLKVGREVITLRHMMSGMGEKAADRLVAKLCSTDEVTLNLDFWTWDYSPFNRAPAGAPVLGMMPRSRAAAQGLCECVAV